jgi:predicted enzyme related to lactoylglutathione lyase
MKGLNRLMTNICSDNLKETKDFYTNLFDFKINYDSDWFIHLVSNDKKLELGLIKRSHDLVPVEFQNKPQGFYITFVVDNADEIYAIAEKEKYKIVGKPTDTAYGQRRLLLNDPSGTLVDISSPIKDFKF